MKFKVEITTKKSFYRITSTKLFNKYGIRFHLWRYFKRKEARGDCWLIWRILLGGSFSMECYALNNKPLEG